MTFIDIFQKECELKEKIQNIISTGINEIVDAGLSKKLRKIRDNFEYNIDEIYSDESWRASDKEDARQKELKKYWEGANDIDDYYIDEVYQQRIREIGTIISSRFLSKHINRSLSNIRACYAHGLNDAAIVFCRALIEATAFEILKSRGHLRNIRFIDSNIALKELMQMVKKEKIVKRYIYDNTWTVIKIANSIIHIEKKEDIPIKNEFPDPLDLIRYTFMFTESLLSF